MRGFHEVFDIAQELEIMGKVQEMLREYIQRAKCQLKSVMLITLYIENFALIVRWVDRTNLIKLLKFG